MGGVGFASALGQVSGQCLLSEAIYGWSEFEWRSPCFCTCSTIGMWQRSGRVQHFASLHGIHGLVRAELHGLMLFEHERQRLRDYLRDWA